MFLFHTYYTIVHRSKYTYKCWLQIEFIKFLNFQWLYYQKKKKIIQISKFPLFLLLSFLLFVRGIHSRVVRVVDLESLAPHHRGFESWQGLDSFIWGSYLASLGNVGGSIWVPTCAWINAQRITWGLPPTVKLECRHITWTVLVPC